MRICWTRRSPGPVVAVRAVEEQEAVAVETTGETFLLDKSGEPVTGPEPSRAPGRTAPGPVEDWGGDLPVRHRAETGEPRLVVAADAERVHVLVEGIPWDSLRLDGEIVGLAFAKNWGLAVAATASGVLYAVHVSPTAAEVAALLCAEQELSGQHFSQAACHFSSLGSPGFAVRRIARLRRTGVLAQEDADRLVAEIARTSGRTLREDPFAAFDAAEALARTGETQTAIGFYQTAADSVRLRARALRAVGDAFGSLGADAAADLAYRRSAACEPTLADKRKIYDFACALQKRARFPEAVCQFELLLSWEAGFQDAWTRAETCRRERTAARPGTRISAYDGTFYHQFENASEPDRAKKHVEMTRLFEAIDLSRTRASLDVGSGTLRYPRLLAEHGVLSVGIDLRDEGIHQLPDDGGPRRFAVADGSALPFLDGSFDLVTCMMGTINHFSRAARLSFVAEAHRVLRPGGVFIVSAWDPRCPHQSFLAMYTPAELSDLRTRLVPPPVLAGEMAAAGFTETGTTPFYLLPDWMATSTGATTAHLDALAEFDAELRAARPGECGQMFFASGRRP
ncbi:MULTISPECIES: class I SAM-dependent methyltransferase [Amycolatopsis]|uniref:Class I SAM-dependent methyltransferase n=1 Tax=Amycolatopsis albidoflavus TaxID=102226 RepID=A0ABW5HX61_9PSEU